MDTAKKWFLLNSGGGGGVQAFDSPAPLRAMVMASDNIDLQWADILQDNSKLYRNTVDNFSTATKIYDGASNEFSDTGLTAGTLYYYYLVVSLAGLKSTVISSSATTFTWKPSYLYEAAGLKFNGTDKWGDLAANFMDKWKDVFGAGPDFVSTVTTPVSRAFFDEVTVPILKYQATSYFTFSMPFASDTDFTIAFEILNSNGGGEKPFIADSVGGDYIGINTINDRIQVKIGGVRKDYYVGTLPIGIIRIKVSRNGAVGSVQINDQTPVTAVMSTSAFTFDTCLSNRAYGFNGPKLSALIIDVSSERTSTETNQYFDRLKMPDYIPDAFTSTTPIFDGVWEDLVDGRTTDSSSLADNGNPYGIKMVSINGYTVALSKKPDDSPTYSDQILRIIEDSTGKITPGTAIPHLVDSNDVHNAQSLFLYDNTVLLVGRDVWYGTAAQQNNLMVRSFGKNFNIKKVYTRKTTKGIAIPLDNSAGYDQCGMLGNVVYDVVQRSLFDKKITAINTSIDGLNTFNRQQLIMALGSDWVYHMVIYSESEVFILWVHSYFPDHTYRAWGILRTTDFNTYYNWEKTNSFTVASAPISMATAISDYSLKDVSAATVKNSPVTNAFITQSGFLYGGCGNGENTAWELFYGADKATLTFNTLDFGAYTVKLPPVVGTDYNRTFIQIYRTGVDAYDIYALVDNSGAYRIAKFTTTDAGATTLIFDSYISANDGRKYWNILRLHNYEYTSSGYCMATSVAADGLTAEHFYFRVK